MTPYQLAQILISLTIDIKLYNLAYIGNPEIGNITGYR